MWFSGKTTRTATYFKQANERKPLHRSAEAIKRVFHAPVWV